MADPKNVLLFFDRPTEPIFWARGDKQFDVPNNYLTDRYKPIGMEVSTRFPGKSKISLKRISLPNMDNIEDLGRKENFSLFNPSHRDKATQLIKIMMGMRSLDDFQSLCAYCHDHVNTFLFSYCLGVAILHRKDLKNVPLPNYAEIFPEKYLDSRAIGQAREELNVVDEGSRMPIIVPRDYTASDLEEEHLVAYFREDLGINLHHWHWHLVYPFDGPREVINKDRRGEIFYYMHQQIIARYNVERFCNKLKRVERFIEWKQPIKEGYFPKLDSLVGNRAWPGRVAGMSMTSINRPLDQVRFDIDDMTRYRDRIYDVIQSGIVRTETGETFTLTEDEGTDVLGNIIESSVLSPNRPYYGELHNLGHLIIGYINDPDNRHLEPFGIMADNAVNMRDPIFYRWHAFVDDLFQEFKGTLPRYTEAQLTFPNVEINSVEVQVEGGRSNELQTFWQQSDLNLTRGMDFSPRGNVFARVEHLQHSLFTYRIRVNNTSNRQLRGTCRIFIAPQFDERGNPFLLRDQRLFYIELDKFTITLDRGDNTVIRRSDESSVTIPFERTFRDLNTDAAAGSSDETQFNFCGCGWPDHMILPKGTTEGYPCHLFVMISDYELDNTGEDSSGLCNDSFAYCGIKDRKYPDKRAMGYPFDRVPRQGVNVIDDFVASANMFVQKVTIKHSERVVVRDQNRQGGQTQGNRGQFGQGNRGQASGGNRNQGVRQPPRYQG